jgi:hypothetical protein
MSGQERYTIIDLRGTRQTVAQGMTSDAPNGLPAFKNPIKEFLCVVMCACRKLFEDNQKAPELQTDGETPGVDAAAAAPETEESASTKPPKLQQNCVSTLFQSLDKAAEYHSPLKAEVWFDMDGYRAGFTNIGDKVPNRPQPLMSRRTPTKPLQWHWGVISHVGRRKNRKLSQPTFTKGGVSLRRPDIVVVLNPTQPPVESNIAMIYELKFDEKPDEQQMRAYRRIVNDDRSRVDIIEVKDCRCEKRKERVREVTREELMAWAAAMMAALAATLAASKNGRRPPDLEPAHVSTGLALLGALAIGAFLLAAAPVEVPAGVAAFIALMLGVGTTAVRRPEDT